MLEDKDLTFVVSDADGGLVVADWRAHFELRLRMGLDGHRGQDIRRVLRC